MAKVKIVQIAISSHEDYPNEYLDDKGRIWFQKYVRDTGVVPGHYEWEQLKLPDEPKA
jgi:hypothetical protein